MRKIMTTMLIPD